MRDIFVVEIFQTFGELHGTCTRLRAGPGISGDTGDLRDLPSGNETWLPNYWEHAGKMIGKWWQIDGKMMGNWWENGGKLWVKWWENDGKMLGNMTHHLEIEVYSWEFHQKVVDFPLPHLIAGVSATIEDDFDHQPCTQIMGIWYFISCLLIHKQALSHELADLAYTKN